MIRKDMILADKGDQNLILIKKAELSISENKTRES
jgi:hypothetical protein